VEARQVKGEVVPFPLRPRRRAPLPVSDVRFRALIGEAGWASLPEAVQARFGNRLDSGRTAIYAGEVVECRMSRLGWLLAQAGRLIGAPLPLSRAALVPASVCVTENRESGQYWTRIYGCRCGFPQVIHSSKRFAGPTGLEEYVGRGFGIALRIVAENGALHFDSDHYFLQLAGLRLRLPRWLEPGALRVSHVDCNHGLFVFVLSLRHRLAGELVRQTAMFRERLDPEEGR
jgi:hypothetical protein